MANAEWEDVAAQKLRRIFWPMISAYPVMDHRRQTVHAWSGRWVDSSPS